MTPAPADTAVSLRDVRFSWSTGSSPVIAIDDWHVARGDRVFVHGASGSGKTTLLSLIGAIITPQNGNLYVDGVDLAQLAGSERDRFRAAHVGIIFQQFNLLPFLSIADNVRLPMRFSPERRQRVLNQSRSLHEETLRLLQSLKISTDDMHHRSVMQLSVGQQQRVAAARALMGSPALIIADEPTSALDHNTRQAFLDLLFREVEAAGSTLLFVSHDPSLASAFDRQVDLQTLNQACSSAMGNENTGEHHA